MDVLGSCCLQQPSTLKMLQLACSSRICHAPINVEAIVASLVGYMLVGQVLCVFAAIFLLLLLLANPLPCVAASKTCHAVTTLRIISSLLFTPCKGVWSTRPMQQCKYLKSNTNLQDMAWW
jgi:hypothetical protein